MEQYVLPASLVIFGIGSLIAVKVGLEKRPTFTDIKKEYRKKELCEEIHKNVDEKLACLPEIKNDVTEIKTKINIFLEKNGKS